MKLVFNPLRAPVLFGPYRLQPQTYAYVDPLDIAALLESFPDILTEDNPKFKHPYLRYNDDGEPK